MELFEADDYHRLGYSTHHFPAISPYGAAKVSNDILPQKNDIQTSTTTLKKTVNKWFRECFGGLVPTFRDENPSARKCITDSEAVKKKTQRKTLNHPGGMFFVDILIEIYLFPCAHIIFNSYSQVVKILAPNSQCTYIL